MTADLHATRSPNCGDARLPTLLLVDAEYPGSAWIVDYPPFTHSYPRGHPTVRLESVELTDADVLGGLGASCAWIGSGSG